MSKLFINTLITLSCLLAVTIASAQPQLKVSGKSFSVKGTINEFKDSTLYIFYLNKRDTIKKKIKLASNGSLKYMGEVEQPTKIFINHTGPAINPSNSEFISKISFWVEPGKATELSTVSSDDGILANGNQTQVDQNEFDRRYLVTFSAQAGIVIRGTQAKKDGNFTSVKPVLDREWDSIEVSKRQIIVDFIRQHPASYVSLSLINEYMYVFKNYNKSEDLVSAFNLLSHHIKSSSFAYKAKEFLGLEGELRIGAIAKEITSKDTSGKRFSISSLRGQYVLVDFWASWCVPCRQEIPKLKLLYNKYHDRKFNIVSVSIDDKRDRWLNALRKENMQWYNVSDLQGSNGMSAKTYNIQSIPQNVLIDPNGKIIAKNLNPAELALKLESVVD